jgi:hypothetical protein
MKTREFYSNPRCFINKLKKGSWRTYLLIWSGDWFYRYLHFCSNRKFQAVKSKWKGGSGSAVFIIHTSVQCCEVWTCLAWGDELNCFNKRIVGQWQEPLWQTRNWDQESKGGSAVGDQECSIRHRSMRKYPGSLINFYVMVYANLIAYFTMDSIVWSTLGAFVASCQIILYYRLMTQVVECGTSMFNHSFYWVVGDPVTLCGLAKDLV